MTTDQKTAFQHTAEYVLGRLKEPSTWAGIAIFVGFFGLSPETLDKMIANGPAIAAAIASLVAILAPAAKKVVTVDSSGDTTTTSVPVGATPSPDETK